MIRKAVPTSMRNEWTTIRKYNKFTGAADRQQKLDVSIPLIRINAQGKEEKTVVNSWFSNEEWIFMQEWEREKERARLYSRSNRNSNGAYMNFGKSGGAIKVGDGLFAQMLYGNTSFYNNYGSNFSIKGLANAVYNICEQGNVPMDQRNFVVLTGQRGMIQVNEAIRKETNGWSAPFTFNGDNLGIIEKTSNPAHQTSLAYGAQFTEWRGPNGLVLKFIVDPSLDDRERNKIPGPNNQGVLSSYAYYIFDLGTSSEPNMFLCKLRNADDTFKYRIGIRNPWGITNNNIINYDEDSAEIHVMTTLGALILDPTRCLAYLPSGMVPA